nr:immunoglobulin light chain junction region [Macaca mulatta]MOV74606.1 immunoglobulin light chain junction region [Macaca mulatta]MOW42739.1 immunoglobulin light chain junction region [Macaca mulatta]MOX84664.1 immunoglobulin light chain junction region [Macaca mulatta]MOX90769.1 immunoglobulin light chain junction region [Macaca mulatta]
CQQYNALPWTF